MTDWSQFHKNAAADVWLGSKQRRGVLIDDVFEQDETFRIWMAGHVMRLPTANLIRGLGPAPSTVKEKTKYRSKLSWVGNYGRLQGEQWRVVFPKDHSWAMLELPGWAQLVAEKFDMPVVMRGRGNNERMRSHAQAIVEKAIEERMYPFELEAS